MLEPGILIEDTLYPWSGLKSNPSSHPILSFCHSWLNQQESFSLYSSGSTGKPKEIKLSRQQMKASAEMTRQLLHPASNDVLLLAMNPDTVGGRMVIVRAMEWNLPVHVIPASANPLKDIDLQHPYTITSLVPYQFIEILKDNDSSIKFNRFRKILLGGSGIDENLLVKIQSLHPDVFHTYGMTETCSHVASRLLNGPEKQARFYPLAPVKIGLNTENALWIESPSGIKAHLQTNDLAHLFPDGGFEILGRADRTIISGGVKIQLEEMEEKISPFLTGRRFYCDGIPDEKLGQKHILVLEGETFDTSSILEDLKKELPAYKAPKAIIFAPRFEMTKSGKIDRINTSLQWAKTN